MIAGRRIPLAIVAAALAGCEVPTEPERPEVPQPAPLEFRPFTTVGVPLAGSYRPRYFPFRRWKCPGGTAALGNPLCDGPDGARRSYEWADGTDRGDLRVEVTRHTYPMLASRNDPRLSVRPITGHVGPPPGSPGDKWYIVWRDTLEVQTGPVAVSWEIAGRWRADSVTIAMHEASIPRKVGGAGAGEFPEPFRSADGAVYFHPAETELATFTGSIMRTGNGDRSDRYALRCNPDAIRPVCSRIDPVVAVTIHGGGVAHLTGRWWRPSWATGSGTVDRQARPDGRGHAIFKDLAPTGDGFTENPPYHPHTRFEGAVAVQCDGGPHLQAEVLTLARADGFEGALPAFGWVFADCRTGIVETMRERYPTLAARSRAISG